MHVNKISDFPSHRIFAQISVSSKIPEVRFHQNSTQQTTILKGKAAVVNPNTSSMFKWTQTIWLYEIYVMCLFDIYIIKCAIPKWKREHSRYLLHIHVEFRCRKKFQSIFHVLLENIRSAFFPSRCFSSYHRMQWGFSKQRTLHKWSPMHRIKSYNLCRNRVFSIEIGVPPTLHTSMEYIYSKTCQ